MARDGDWIDEMAAKSRNVPRPKVCSIKEKKLDLAKVDRKDALQLALEIYYEDLIGYVLKKLAAEWKHCQATIDDPLDVCVAGGSSMVPGFIPMLQRALHLVELPFKVKAIKHSKDPLNAVAAGALVAALSHEKKTRAAGSGPAPGGRLGSAVEAAARIDAVPAMAGAVSVSAGAARVSADRGDGPKGGSNGSSKSRV